MEAGGRGTQDSFLLESDSVVKLLFGLCQPRKGSLKSVMSGVPSKLLCLELTPDFIYLRSKDLWPCWCGTSTESSFTQSCEITYNFGRVLSFEPRSTCKVAMVTAA